MRTIFAAILLLAAGGVFAQESKVTLKEGQGKDKAMQCAACHSLDYIHMNSRFLDKAGWTATTNKMINVFHAPIAKEDVEAIASYLAQNYGKPPAQNAAKQKVIFQVSDADPAKWNLALNNARNVQTELGKDNVQIEIVAYGPGLAMLKRESKVEGRLAQALDDNVGLIACENTMTNTHVTKEDMYSGIGYTPAGVTHLMKRQREGWAYIRP